MEQMRLKVFQILKDLGFQNITMANNGKEALDALIETKNKEKFDLLISDWNMPIVSGIDLLREVKHNPQYYDLPFIMMTTESEKDKVIDAISLGINNYIYKPVTARDLKQKISQVIEFD
ncbi:MAG: response regulator [Bacteriovoracaceae bacterium]|jgi:two-component system, chemotaxis family, chemotaxis protein CheY|nr:response regulator [Bacteriovoracaceae bacterium]